MPDLSSSVKVIVEFDNTPTAALMDYDWAWRNQAYTPFASLITAIDANATSLTVSAISKTFTVTTSPNSPPYGQVQSVQTPVTITPGSCLTLDDEPMTVTAVSVADANGNFTLTVVRGISQNTVVNGTISFPFAVPVPHAAGAIVNVLQYFSPWERLRQRAWIPELQAAVTARGPQSAIFQSVASGQIQVASA